MKYTPVATVSERIRKAMELSGLKQVELSEKTGLSKSLINQYISGNITNAKTDKILLLSRALDVDATWLMGYDVPIRKEHDSGDNYTIDELSMSLSKALRIPELRLRIEMYADKLLELYELENINIRKEVKNEEEKK